jgi:formylmethanofuran:tetrahydromethanopterin formyltransferase
MFRIALFASAAFALGACGDIAANVEQAKQGAIELGQDALEVGAGAVDTRTACLLAGQSEALCGCVQERLGRDITPEHVEILTEVVRASLDGQGVEAATQSAEGVDAATREALLQCATTAAIQGAMGE